MFNIFDSVDVNWDTKGHPSHVANNKQHKQCTPQNHFWKCAHTCEKSYKNGIKISKIVI